MKNFYLVILLGLLWVFAGCQQDSVLNNEEVIDEVETDVDEEAEWMEEENVYLTDSAILQTRANENLGWTISYSLFAENRGDDADGNGKLYISFAGDRFEFELGYFAPNRSDLVITSLHEQERKNKQYSLPYYDELFATHIEKTEVTEFFEEETKWELTAADVTGDGELEIILLARDRRDMFIPSVITTVAIYRYTGDESKPFKLLTQFSGESQRHWNDQHIYYTNGNEFVQDVGRETFVRAYLEDGKWYIEDLHNLRNLSESILYHYDGDYEMQSGANSYYGVLDHDNLFIVDEDDPVEMNDDSIAWNEDRPILTEPAAIDQLAKDDEQAGLDAIEYARRSTEARTEGDYDRVFELVKEGSPIDDELKKLIKDNQERGVELTYDGGEVVHTDVVSSGKMYDVTLHQSFYIYGVKKEGLRHFETTYRMQYDNSSGNFQAVELLDEIEI